LLREECLILEEECLRLERSAHTTHKKHLADQNDIKRLDETNRELSASVGKLRSEAESEAWTSREWTAELQKKNDEILHLQSRLSGRSHVRN